MSRFSVKKLILAFMTLGLMACGEAPILEDSMVARRTARGASALLQSNTGSGLPLEPMSNKSWGEIVGDFPDIFTFEAQGLVQATLAPNDLGSVGHLSGSATGIRFWGSVDLESGPLNSSAVTATNVASNTAQLRIVIWDTLAGTQDINGNIIPEYSISFDQAVSGSVSGNSATITYEDKYGRVTLSGTFDQSFFIGTVSYQNFVSYTPLIAPISGTLGSFRVQTCGFFTCQ